MMTNLFSIFDTSTNMSIDWNWISSFCSLLVLPQLYWCSPSKFYIFTHKIFSILYNELKVILVNKYNSLNSICLISLFTFIFLNNFIGLFPFIFTSSSHMIFSLSISIPLWLSLMIFSWSKNKEFMFAHMIPQGTPIPLMSFMVLIETISNTIRPMTLSIRLSANMIAGHLLLTLMSSSVQSFSPPISFMIITIQILLLTLEFSVATIQAYVFTILTTLYIKETN